MAPEQLAGKGVTIKSDIYSLGLVMYEVLTGRRAYDAATLQELIKSRGEGTITNPSALVKDLDPLVERVILRCLDEDPEKRPASASASRCGFAGRRPISGGTCGWRNALTRNGCGRWQYRRLAAPAGHRVHGFASLLLTALLPISDSAKVVSEKFAPKYSAEVLRHKAQEIRTNLGYASPSHDSHRVSV